MITEDVADPRRYGAQVTADLIWNRRHDTSSTRKDAVRHPAIDAAAVRALDSDYRNPVAALDNMELALAAAAASITDVIFTRVLVATNDRDDLRSVWAVVAERFGEHDVPSTLVGVTVLGYRAQLVEIEAVAALSDD